LGYTFRPRLSKSRHGNFFVNLSPAVSDDAKTAIGREIRSWRVNCRSDKTRGWHYVRQPAKTVKAVRVVDL
jgi:RNA-directed DNA polymerase